MSKKTFAITIIFATLLASMAGGIIVSSTVENTISRRLQSELQPSPIIDVQTNANNQEGNTSNTYQIPPNATSTTTKTSTASSSSHEQHHKTSSSPEGMTPDGMNSMMADNGMYESMENGLMDQMMSEMMPGMLALMSDNMKAMMAEMMIGNMTDGSMISGSGNQSMTQEMNQMLQNMDKTLTILSTITNASIANGNISNETITSLTNSINQIITMMDGLTQMMKTTTTGSSMSTMNSSTNDINSGNTAIPSVDNSMANTD